MTVLENLEVVNEIFRIIRRINREGTTVLLVEQNVKQAMKVSQYAYVLETGKIVLSGTTAELLGKPQDQGIVPEAKGLIRQKKG